MAEESCATWLSKQGIDSEQVDNTDTSESPSWHLISVQRQFLPNLRDFSKLSLEHESPFGLVEGTSNKLKHLKQICHSEIKMHDPPKSLGSGYKGFVLLWDHRESFFQVRNVIFRAAWKPRLSVSCNISRHHLFFELEGEKTLQIRFVEWKILKIAVQSSVLVRLTYKKQWEEGKEQLQSLGNWSACNLGECGHV